MTELKDIINNTNTDDVIDKALVALLSSDKAFVYTPTYILDNEDSLKRLKGRILFLSKTLTECSDNLQTKISNGIVDVLDCSYNVQLNQAVEIKSNSDTIDIVDGKEQTLLDYLSNSREFPLFLSLHFTYQLIFSETLFDIDNLKSHTIEHTFKVMNSDDIEGSMDKFLSIINKHIDAKN